MNDYYDLIIISINIKYFFTYLTLIDESSPGPYPKDLAKSLPVPNGSKTIKGNCFKFKLSIVLRTHLKLKNGKTLLHTKIPIYDLMGQFYLPF